MNVRLGVMAPTTDPILEQLRQRVSEGIEGAVVIASAGSPGHYRLEVTAEAFRGLSRVQAQRLVYRCIAPLMSGHAAPVHAVDALVTRTPT